MAAPQTVKYARRRLKRPLDAFGDAQAGDVTPESLQKLLARVDGKAWRHDILRTLRMGYRFGMENHLVDKNPARVVRTSQPVRSERMLPLTIAEVDGVAEECGQWGPLVVFMADTGARPGEALAVEWRHVDLDAGTVELPGAKTELSWRTVYLTSRGIAAVKSMPRALTTRRVFTSTVAPSPGSTSVVRCGRRRWSSPPRETTAVLAPPLLRPPLAAGRGSDR